MPVEGLRFETHNTDTDVPTYTYAWTIEHICTTRPPTSTAHTMGNVQHAHPRPLHTPWGTGVHTTYALPYRTHTTTP